MKHQENRTPRIRLTRELWEQVKPHVRKDESINDAIERLLRDRQKT